MIKSYFIGVYSLLLVLLIFGLYAQKIYVNKYIVDNNKQEVEYPSASEFSKSKIICKISMATNHAWCYEILDNGKMMIHHPSVHGLPCEEKIKTQAAAQQTIDLKIQKVKIGEMPPSITKEEMQKMS
jgi:hypothetical protein